MKKPYLTFFIFAVCVHIAYYISAYFTHFLDIFFDHVTMGQDFFQIPNAVYAFLHGGSLTGDLPSGIARYTDCCGVNYNVYHPLFTLLIGYPLQLLVPWTAFAIWAGMHAIVTIIVCIFILKKFSQNKNVYIALAFFLLFSYHYYEIQHAQYHFLVVFFTILLLYETLQHGDTKKAGLWFFLSLLVKPIGLLWIMPLLVHKRYKTVLWGLGLFFICSAPFFLLPWSKYYFSNLYYASGSIHGANNLFILSNLLPISGISIKIAGSIIALFLFIFQLLKKTPLFFMIFQWAGYQLIFYPLSFHYQYTIVAGFILIGFLFSYFSVKRLEIVPIIFLTLPPPIIFFYLMSHTRTLTNQAYALTSLWTIAWLCCLLLHTLFFTRYERVKQ